MARSSNCRHSLYYFLGKIVYYVIRYKYVTEVNNWLAARS